MEYEKKTQGDFIYLCKFKLISIFWSRFYIRGKFRLEDLWIQGDYPLKKKLFFNQTD
jgi:hypothetical protein